MLCLGVSVESLAGQHVLFGRDEPVALVARHLRGNVPARYAKHMMIVADLENGQRDAIEDAVIGAWELQSGK